MGDRELPMRPRKHQLESESRAAIRAAIPSVWVYRDLDQDYGIDSEIEIFDKSGLATAAKFWVQIKATDEPDLRNALRLWFPNSKGEYYSSLDLPVLIVRYHAPSKRLFTRWFHTMDPYYGDRTRAGVSFRLTVQDAWDETTPERLAKEVEAYRDVRAPNMRHPLHFSLSIDGHEIRGIPAYQLRLNLQEAMRQVAHLVILQVDAPAGGALPHAISVTNEKIEVTVGGMHGFTLHTPRVYAEEKAGNSLHHDIMLCIGLALDTLGHPVEAAEIISPFLRKSNLVRDLQVAFPLALCLARANQIHRALEISEHFVRDESTVDAAQIFLTPFLTRQEGLLYSERDFGARVMIQIAQEVDRRGDRERAAVLNYSCANLLRSMSRFRDAIRHYRKAARLDAAYLTRPYYWRELAGVMFLNRRYALAAKFYRRSLDLQDDRLTRALYADALMFAGQYLAAEEHLNGLLKPPVDPRDAEWALKCVALSWLREMTGLDEQRRTTFTFPDSFSPGELEDIEIERVCKEALDLDALSALAWFNLGGVQHRAGDNDSAAKCFLLAALIVPWDIGAWGNVLALSMQGGNGNLFFFALCTSYRVNGEKILRHIVDQVPEGRDAFAAKLAELIDMLPKRSDELILRSHHKTGWDEIVIAPDGRIRRRVPLEGTAQ